MKIQKITDQHRRDFQAVYVCEHCGETESGRGYDDSYFHNNVIPNMKCKSCGKSADSDYRPLAPKYPEGVMI